MRFLATSLPEVFVVEPEVHGDHRGFFMESYNRRELAAVGLDRDWVQDNHSRSCRGVLRGLHYQVGCPQAKLVRAVVGAVFDVVVDVRHGSPTFGRWFGAELSAANHRMLFAPRGMAHGFLVLSDVAEFVYKVDAYYCAAAERSIRWDDPELAIGWPLDGGLEPILSAKDASCPLLADLSDDDLPAFAGQGGP